MIRISWTIDNASGHGDWFSNDNQECLQAWVDEMNRKYGRGTHKIEYSSKNSQDG